MRRDRSTKSPFCAISCAKAESGRNRQFLPSSLAKARSITAVKYSYKSASISMARSDKTGSDAPESSRCSTIWLSLISIVKLLQKIYEVLP